MDNNTIADLTRMYQEAAKKARLAVVGVPVNDMLQALLNALMLADTIAEMVMDDGS